MTKSIIEVAGSCLPASDPFYGLPSIYLSGLLQSSRATHVPI
ncbi:MAG: hypothetical protein AAF485_03885 [Chloroflexota bacterium]